MEPLHQALGSLAADLAEPLLAHVALALAPEAATRLHRALNSELSALEAEGVRGPSAAARLMRLSEALAQLADAAGDPAATDSDPAHFNGATGSAHGAPSMAQRGTVKAMYLRQVFRPG